MDNYAQNLVLCLVQQITTLDDSMNSIFPFGDGLDLHGWRNHLVGIGKELRSKIFTNYDQKVCKVSLAF